MCDPVSALVGAGTVLNVIQARNQAKGQAKSFRAQARVNRRQAKNLKKSIPIARRRAAEARRRAKQFAARAKDIGSRVDLVEKEAEQFRNRAGILIGRSVDSLILAAATEKFGTQAIDTGEIQASRAIRKADKTAGLQIAKFAGGDVAVDSESVASFVNEVKTDGRIDARLIREGAAREKFSHDTKAQGLRYHSKDLQFQAKNTLNIATKKVQEGQDIAWNVDVLKNTSTDFKHNAQDYDLEVGNIKTEIANLKDSASYSSAAAGRAKLGGLLGAGSAISGGFLDYVTLTG